jgi:demethylmenaquinone methyltransferase / 2-methoxy-6-polyprenyl-1,4-benzoquinol methylase
MSRVTLPTGAAKRTEVTAMFDRVAPSYERLNRLISLGQDRTWRRRTLDALGLGTGALVLDAACGTGDLGRDLAARGARPVGLDLSPGMLAHAYGTVPFVLADVAAQPWPAATFDGLTCGFALRNFVDLDGFLAECGRILRPGGRIALLDAAEPTGRLARLGHGIWFRHAVPAIGGLLGDRAAYRYLPASAAYLPSGAELVDRLRAAGFVHAERETFTLGSVQLLTGTRSG